MTRIDGGKRLPTPEEIIDGQRETIASLHARIMFLERLIDGLWKQRNETGADINTHETPELLERKE